MGSTDESFSNTYSRSPIRMTSQRRVPQRLKPVSHSAKCTCSASLWLRQAAEQSRFSYPTACRKGLCTRLGNGSQSSPTSVIWSCHLVLCSPRLGSLRSTFTYRQLLNSCAWYSFSAPGTRLTTRTPSTFASSLCHASSFTVIVLSMYHVEAEAKSLFFVFALLWLSSGKASSWLGRRFVCKEFMGSGWPEHRQIPNVDELVATFPPTGDEQFTSFLWIPDVILIFVQGMSDDHSVFFQPGHDHRPSDST